MLFRKEDRNNFGETLRMNMTHELIVVANLTQSYPFIPAFKIVSEFPDQNKEHKSWTDLYACTLRHIFKLLSALPALAVEM